VIPGKRIPPAEALSLLKVDDDLIVEELAHEPEVAQPTHVSFDARGRMWVSQYRQYPFPKGIKMVSRDQYYRSRYDKELPAPPHHDKGADIISVHEDTDGDGIPDKHTRVLEGLNMANSAVSGWGGIWIMHTPYLLFYPDANGDDVPDGDPEVRLAGFGFEDTHSVANGLVWGPDGWLYGGQGSTTTSRVTRPGIDDEGTYVEGCMIWRYHPKTRAYEVFADGGGNVFGLSFDDDGRLFTGHNGGATRGWHHLQEGLFLKQGKSPEKFGPPQNPFAFGELPMMSSTNPVPRFSHMLVLVGGSAMPERLKGKFLCIDPLHHHAVAAERRQQGSTFETTDIGFPLQSDDQTFRPVFLANAPDGSVVIADFREEYIAHGQNFQGQIDPESGRIYRLRGKAEELETDYNLDAKTSSELISILDHKNIWHRQTAVRLLGQRAEADTVAPLISLLNRPETHPALEALWALHQMGKLDTATAVRLLEHPVPVVRAWACRLVGDSRTLSVEFLTKLESIAVSEPDAEVRCQILSTARRLPAAQALALVRAVLRDDIDDPFIPLMAWFVIESHCAENRDAVLEMFSGEEIWQRPPIRQHIVPRLMRRFAEAGTRSDFLTCVELLKTAPGEEDRVALLKGFEQAFEGRVPPPFPDELVAVTSKGSLSLQIRQGNVDAIQKGLGLLADQSAEINERLAAIRAFGTNPHPDAVAPLLQIVLLKDSDESLPRAALVSLQTYTDESIGEMIATSYQQQSAALQPTALNLLASRPSWSIAMLKSVDKNAITPDILTRLRMHGDSDLNSLLTESFPDSATPKPQESLEAVRALLAAKPGDPYAGETTFMNRCASCHTLFFKGGKIGPDLTSYQRDDLSTMLVSILDPNAEIREGFENHIVTTRDGRVLSGFLSDEDANTITLRGFDGSDIQLTRDQIEKQTPAGRSLMPEGLLNGLDDQQLRNLFAYLKIPQPISR
jgi:putative heme-binding domain-containing protein